MSESVQFVNAVYTFSQYCSELEWYARGEEVHAAISNEVEEHFMSIPEAELVYVIFDGEFSYGSFWSVTDDNGMTMYHTCIGNANYECGTIAEMCEILYREHYLVEDGGQPLDGMRMTDVNRMRQVAHRMLQTLEQYIQENREDGEDSAAIEHEAQAEGVRDLIKTIDGHIYGNSDTRAAGSITMQRVDDEIRKVYKRKGWL